MVIRVFGLVFVLNLLLSACTMAPSVNVLGAFFPGWLFCIIGSLILTLLIRQILTQRQLFERLGPPVVILPTLFILFSLISWLIFF